MGKVSRAYSRSVRTSSSKCSIRTPIAFIDWSLPILKTATPKKYCEYYRRENKRETLVFFLTLRKIDSDIKWFPDSWILQSLRNSSFIRWLKQSSVILNRRIRKSQYLPIIPTPNDTNRFFRYPGAFSFGSKGFSRDFRYGNRFRRDRRR